MSVEVTGLWGDVALFADENGPAEIPVRELSRLHTKADYANGCTVTVNGRRYHRDTLARPLRDFENGDLRVLDPCGQCHDAPGIHPVEGGGLWCTRCCSSAQGSHLDDRMEV